MKNNNPKQLLSQSEEITNKPSFLIHSKRAPTLTSNKIYNHLLVLVLTELRDKSENNKYIFKTSMKKIKNSLNSKKLSNNHIWKNIEILQQTLIQSVGRYSKRDKYTKKSFPLLGGVELNEKSGEIRFDMSVLFVEHLVKLSDEKNLLYAKLENDYIKKFKVKVSQYMYEYLVDLKGQWNINISIKDVRKLLHKEKVYVDNNPLFRQKVLTPSLQEILNTTNLNYEFEYKKYTNDFEAEEEDYLFIKMKKQDEELDKTKIKYAVLSLWKRFGSTKSFKIADLEVCINEDNYLYEATAPTSKNILKSEKAFEIWGIIYKTFKNDNEKLYRLLESTKEEFDYFYNGGQ